MTDPKKVLTPKGKKVQKKVLQKKAKVMVKDADANPVQRSRTSRQGMQSLDGDRLKAMAVYVTDTRGLTVKELHADPRFKHIHYDTLRKWATDDDWIGIRRQAVASLRAHLVEELQKTLASNLEREVQDLLNMRAQAIHYLSSVPPEKWEGVATIMLKVSERLAVLAEATNEKMVDSVGQRSGKVTHDFDPAQLREAARSITTKERGAARARAAKKAKSLARKAQGS